MNPYFNDTDFQAKHEHYNDMLRAATANIELRRGELPRDHSWLGSIVVALTAGMSALVRRHLAKAGEALTVSADPCPDPEPCN